MAKFFNRKVTLFGHKFDSVQECDRYKELLLLERQGKIKCLDLQHPFEIIPKLIREETIQLKTKTKIVYRTEEHHAIYTCDFYYYDVTEGAWIIEEYKSPMTAKLQDYVLRRKLIKQLIKKWEEEGKERHVFREVIYKKNSKRKTKL